MKRFAEDVATLLARKRGGCTYVIPRGLVSGLGIPALFCALLVMTGCGYHLNNVSADVVLTPSNANLGTAQVGIATSPHTLTLTNQSPQPVAITSVSSTVPDFVATSDCPVSPTTLAPHGSCNISVVFAPSTTGTRSGAVDVAYSGGTAPVTAALTGTAVAAPVGISLSPASLTWINIPQGQTSPTQDVTLANTGSTALSISSLAVGSSYTVASTTCPLSPSTLTAAASCTISVAFQPQAAGPSTGTLTVVDSDPTSPQTVALSGTAIASPLLITPATLAFANTAVGVTSPIQTVTITNQEATPLSLTIAATAEFTQTNNCPAVLAANASCAMSVAFAPVSPGTKTGSVTITYPSGLQSVSLTGTSNTPPAGSVTLSPPVYNFPNQAVGVPSNPEILTLTNGQSTALNISSVQINAPFSQTNTCGASLAAGANCAISIVYSPTVSGTNAASLIITDDAPDSPQTAAIAGSAGVRPISTVPAAGGLYFFNQILLTSSTPLPVTITNNQAVPLNITSITSTADYPFTTDCTTAAGTGILASNATCTVEVSFLPQALGQRPASLTISNDAAGSPILIPLTGTGIAGDTGTGISVGPIDSCTLPSHTQQFTAFVNGAATQAVNWYVNGVLNGSSGAGTITANGLYTAPAAPGSYGIKAISQTSPSDFNFVTIAVSNTPTFTIYPFAASVAVGGQQTFQPQLCTAPDSEAVTWTVDGIAGGNATVGTITSSGVYTAPALAGKHTVRVADATLPPPNNNSGALVTVYSNIAVDFDSRTNTSYPIPANLFGYGRGESIQSVSDRNLLTQAGVTTSRLYAQIPLVYATPTPDWTKIDPIIADVKASGQTVLLQLSLSPPWLQPNPNPCGTGNSSVAPTDPVKWAQIAASYVAHMDATFPGVVQDYEIWNEPNATGMCAKDHLKSYMAVYAAAAPLMKQQAATDGTTIRVGGPALSNYSAYWLSALLSDPTTAPYVDFVSYHHYIFGKPALQVQWDTYNANPSMYQETQDSGNSAQTVYNKVYTAVKAGSQPLGANTPIYLTEFNTNWAFFKDCCRNDATYAPVWNALYISDLLNIAYAGEPVPKKMVYFAGSAYPWFCMIGVLDPTMDCLYSSGSVPQPYPQYYSFDLIASHAYLGLVDGGYLAKSVSVPTGGGGLAVSGFYTPSQDAVLITNPTPTAYSQIQVVLENVGFNTPQVMLYQVVKGAMINSSSLTLTPQTTGYSVTVDIPPYSVQAISVKGP